MPRSRLLAVGAAWPPCSRLSAGPPRPRTTAATTATARRGPRPDAGRDDQPEPAAQFNARNPDRISDIQAITGLPAGVTLRGIDFRPKTGDLYGVGSDSVVYRVNP